MRRFMMGREGLVRGAHPKSYRFNQASSMQVVSDTGTKIPIGDHVVWSINILGISVAIHSSL